MRPLVRWLCMLRLLLTLGVSPATSRDPDEEHERTHPVFAVDYGSSATRRPTSTTTGVTTVPFTIDILGTPSPSITTTTIHTTPTFTTIVKATVAATAQPPSTEIDDLDLDDPATRLYNTHFCEGPAVAEGRQTVLPPEQSLLRSDCVRLAHAMLHDPVAPPSWFVRQARYVRVARFRTCEFTVWAEEGGFWIGPEDVGAAIREAVKRSPGPYIPPLTGYFGRCSGTYWEFPPIAGDGGLTTEGAFWTLRLTDYDMVDTKYLEESQDHWAPEYCMSGREPVCQAV